MNIFLFVCLCVIYTCRCTRFPLTFIMQHSTEVIVQCASDYVPIINIYRLQNKKSKHLLTYGAHPFASLSARKHNCRKRSYVNILKTVNYYYYMHKCAHLFFAL